MHELTVGTELDDVCVSLRKALQTFGQHILRIVDEFLHLPLPPALPCPIAARHFAHEIRYELVQFLIGVIAAEIREIDGMCLQPLLLRRHMQSSRVRARIGCEKTGPFDLVEMTDLENGLEMSLGNGRGVGFAANLRNETAVLSQCGGESLTCS